MTIAEQREYLAKLAKEIKIPQEWLNKKYKTLWKNYSYRLKYKRHTNILYVYKDVKFIFEVVVNKNGVTMLGIRSALLGNRLFSNSYWIMGIGWRAKYEFDFKHKRGGETYRTYYVTSLADYGVVYKGPNFLRAVNDMWESRKHIYETAYKEGWIKYLNLNRDYNSNKGRVALGLELLTKNEWKHWLNVHNDLKIKDITIYSDFVKIAHRKGVSKFADNWLELHDQWIIRGDLKNAVRKEAVVEKMLKTQEYKTIDKLYKIKSLKELKSLGKQEHHCVGTVRKNWKNFWVASVKDINITIEKDNNYWEIRSFHNADVPEQLQKQIKQMILKEESERKQNGKI